MLKIAVLASGRGSNFQSIIDSIKSGFIKAVIDVLITDNKDAYAVTRARENDIDSLFLDPKDFPAKDGYYDEMTRILRGRSIGLIVLAGFMRIVGKPLIDAFRGQIMNIHPAILPSFPGLNGQGQAHEYGVKIAGCTVHFVDEGMDTGPVIVQAAVPVYSDDTEETLSARILSCEHRIYPYAVKLFSENRLEVQGRKVVIRDEIKRDVFLIHPWERR